MTFLRQEVQGEEMVVLSRTGFASNNVTRKKEYVCTPLNEISGDPRQLRQPWRGVSFRHVMEFRQRYPEM
ncbi:hypothetical protein TNCV_537241 [Trichonephila clavipes]|nr:hypothetical protein TNCV_537241 [Trichonephila clavipes]